MKIFYKATSEIAFRLLHSVEFSSLPYLALTLGIYTVAFEIGFSPKHFNDFILAHIFATLVLLRLDKFYPVFGLPQGTFRAN
jgi:hypothetical protein